MDRIQTRVYHWLKKYGASATALTNGKACGANGASNLRMRTKEKQFLALLFTLQRLEFFDFVFICGKREPGMQTVLRLLRRFDSEPSLSASLMNDNT